MSFSQCVPGVIVAALLAAPIASAQTFVPARYTCGSTNCTFAGTPRMSVPYSFDVDSCRTQCRGLAGCNAFTYYPANQYCNLFSANGAAGANTYSQAAGSPYVLQPPPPPPPPPVFEQAPGTCGSANCTFAGTPLDSVANGATFVTCHSLCDATKGCNAFTFLAGGFCQVFAVPLSLGANAPSQAAASSLMVTFRGASYRCGASDCTFDGKPMTTLRANPQVCSTICLSAAGCNAFTYYPSNGTCDLFSTGGLAANTVALTSGTPFVKTY